MKHGTIKTHDITYGQLKYHTVFSDLYHDFVDIVMDTKPEDLYPLISTLKANSQISIIDILQQVSRKKVESYVLDESENLRPTTFADKVEMKVSGMVKADDLSQLIIQIAKKIASLTTQIKSICKSDKIYQDNRELLKSILQEVSSMLNLRLK